MLAKAFQDRLLALQANMLNFAYLLTENREDAMDLLQETTLKALNNEDKYSEKSNFKGWVFTIMRNIFINNYRRSHKISMIVDSTADLYHLNMSPSGNTETPDSMYAEKEINSCINSFSDDYRKPFSMHVAGYSYAEIASSMHLPVGTIKSRIYYARQRLRRQLKDYR